MRRYSRLWVVIADGEHARVVAPQAPQSGQSGLHTVLTMVSPEAGKRSSDIESDRLGRTFEASSPTRHAITPRHDPHQLAKDAFLRSVAERIDAEATAKAFDHLVLVAPPHALPTLREALSPQTAAMVVGTLGRDLTKTHDSDLTDHLREWLF